MGPGSMRDAWTRHKSVVKLEDPFFLHHLAARHTKSLLRQQEKQARITTSRSKPTKPGSGKIPGED